MKNKIKNLIAASALLLTVLAANAQPIPNPDNSSEITGTSGCVVFDNGNVCVRCPYETFILVNGNAMVSDGIITIGQRISVKIIKSSDGGAPIVVIEDLAG